jgi:Tfp pilus assembly protein PilF
VAEAAQGAVRIAAESAQQATEAAAEAKNPGASREAVAAAVVRAQKAAARAEEAAAEASDDMQQVATVVPAAPIARIPQSNEARDAFAAGKRTYEAHDLMEARRHLETALRLDPELDEARALLGWAEFFSGATRAATVTFKTALRRQPTWEGLYNGLGWSRLRLNRPHLARDAFRAALDANPTYTDALAGWGLALYELDEYAAAIPALDEAAATLERALGRGAPELVDLHEAIAWSLYRTGRFGEAAVEFERVLQARPSGSEPQAALGWSYLKVGRRGEARAAFQRALELAPNSADAARGLQASSP